MWCGLYGSLACYPLLPAPDCVPHTIRGRKQGIAGQTSYTAAALTLPLVLLYKMAQPKVYCTWHYYLLVLLCPQVHSLMPIFYVVECELMHQCQKSLQVCKFSAPQPEESTRYRRQSKMATFFSVFALHQFSQTPSWYASTPVCTPHTKLNHCSCREYTRKQCNVKVGHQPHPPRVRRPMLVCVTVHYPMDVGVSASCKNPEFCVHVNTRHGCVCVCGVCDCYASVCTKDVPWITCSGSLQTDSHVPGGSYYLGCFDHTGFGLLVNSLPADKGLCYQNVLSNIDQCATLEPVQTLPLQVMQEHPTQQYTSPYTITKDALHSLRIITYCKQDQLSCKEHYCT